MVELEYDVIVIGSGIGGLVTATQLAAKGAKVLVLESYIIPGGSAGYFEREGYRFDVGASMIFGFGDRGTTNLLTKALATVEQTLPTIVDPVQIHYHLPDNVSIKVHYQYEKFLQELIKLFPHEAQGIRAFYDECWKIFNCLNQIELLSLEEYRYVARVFLQHPLACLGLAKYLPQNVSNLARRHLRDPILLKFLDLECYCWSVMPASGTPAINAGMVLSDRHYGGVRYPSGGVGQIAQKLVTGLIKFGGKIRYKARVSKIIIENQQAVGVKLTNGKEYRARRIVSNATRWDTFNKLVSPDKIPFAEQKWQQRYQKAPSFISLHLGVSEGVIPTGTECHHVLLENWDKMEQPRGTIFVSIPTILDPSLAPEGHQIIHTFTPSYIDEWQNLTPQEYQSKKEITAAQICDRLSAIFPKLIRGMDFQEVGTPRTHRRFLNRQDGTYGPIPRRPLLGLLGMPFNRTAITGLYCVGDSTFPGQGLNAVAFSGMSCSHRIAVDLGLS
jgi:prolycopene isomerase